MECILITKRRTGIVALLGVVLIASVGCDVVKAGTKCRSGAAPGRDATHLVLCQKGRWTKSLTLQETANILVGLQPKTAEVVAGSEQSAVVGTFFAKAIEVKVTRNNGSAAVLIKPGRSGQSPSISNFRQGVMRTAYSDKASRVSARICPNATPTIGPISCGPGSG